MPYAVYILECADGSYYTGLARDLEMRLEEHQSGAHRDSYTFSRRPVKLLWYFVIEEYSDAFHLERQIKGWSRAKKEALMLNGFDGVHEAIKSSRAERRRAAPKVKREKGPG